MKSQLPRIKNLSTKILFKDVYSYLAHPFCTKIDDIFCRGDCKTGVLVEIYPKEILDFERSWIGRYDEGQIIGSFDDSGGNN